MKIYGSVLVASVAAIVSLDAAAQSATYDFTGTVVTTSGIYSSIAYGTDITGTYTIDLTNAVASQSSLPISTTSDWYAEEASGSYYGISTPNPLDVFSQTASVDGVLIYSTNPVPGAYAGVSYVEGTIVGSTANYFAGEEEDPTSTSFSESFIHLLNADGVIPWSSSGLPIFSGATIGGGTLAVGGASSGTVDYSITSFSLAVPEPSTYALLLAGLGLAGFAAHRRRR